jgi:DNA-binding beta-propeller fold protein YncE
MYWTDSFTPTSRVQMSNLDGTGVQTIVTSGQISPRGLVVDSVNGKVYWANQGAGKIQRSDLGGSNVVDLISAGTNGPDGLAVDLLDGWLFWTDAQLGTLNRANLNGSNVEVLLTGIVAPRGLALDITPTPEPTTISLGALAFIIILGRRMFGSRSALSRVRLK